MHFTLVFLLFRLAIAAWIITRPYTAIRRALGIDVDFL